MKKAIAAFAAGKDRIEIKALSDDIAKLDKIRDMLLEGYRKASENFKARESEQKNTAGEAEVVNSFKDKKNITNATIDSTDKDNVSNIKNPNFDKNSLINNSLMLQKMSIVKKLNGNEFKKEGVKTLRERITDFFESLGNSVRTEQFGDVKLTKSSIHSKLRHGITYKKLYHLLQYRMS